MSINIKKGLITAAATVSLATLSLFNVCFASSDNGDVLASEQKTAQVFITAIDSNNEDAPDYAKFSKHFSTKLKAQIKPHTYDKLRYKVAEQYGDLTNVKFYAYTCYDDIDKIKYVGSFSKENAVSIDFTFNKEQELLAFVFTPLKAAQLADRQLGAIGAAETVKKEKQTADAKMADNETDKTAVNANDDQQIAKLKRMKAEIKAQAAKHAEMLEQIEE